LVVIYFAGRIAMIYVTSSAKNQERLIDGTLERMKELADQISDNTKSTVELTKAVERLTAAVETSSEHQAEEHRAIIDGLKRLGGFRPSSDREQPAVRVDPGGYRARTPSTRGGSESR
jgi:23S rRNA G2445 N2-methylase RlmL